MKIHLENIKINHALCENSIFFTAVLFVNDIKTAYVSSNGTGSSFFYSVFCEKDSEEYLQNKKLLQDAMRYASSQPPVYEREYGIYKLSDIDTIVNDEITEYINTQELATA